MYVIDSVLVSLIFCHSEVQLLGPGMKICPIK